MHISRRTLAKRQSVSAETVRAPSSRRPRPGSARRTLTPRLLSRPWRSSSIAMLRLWIHCSGTLAGATCTPRRRSVAAIRPATWPHGGMERRLPRGPRAERERSGSTTRGHGAYSAGEGTVEPLPPGAQAAGALDRVAATVVRRVEQRIAVVVALAVQHLRALDAGDRLVVEARRQVGHDQRHQRRRQRRAGQTGIGLAAHRLQRRRLARAGSGCRGSRRCRSPRPGRAPPVPGAPARWRCRCPGVQPASPTKSVSSRVARPSAPPINAAKPGRGAGRCNAARVAGSRSSRITMPPGGEPLRLRPMRKYSMASAEAAPAGSAAGSRGSITCQGCFSSAGP